MKKQVTLSARAGPMIREIEIENFRGLERLRLSFAGVDGKPSRIAVLGGPNGCGKTSVLEACLLAAGHKDLLCGPVGRKAVRQGARDYRITATFEDETGEHRQIVDSDERKPAHFVVACDYFPSWRAPKLVGPSGITSGRKGRRPEALRENRLGQIKQYLIDAKAHKSMTSAESNSATWPYDVTITRINETWEMFHPESGQRLSVEPTGTDPSEGFDLFLHLRDGERVPSDALSSGQLELLCFAGSLLPAKESQLVSIVCVDEPELHLDPQWHRLVLRAMMKLRPNCQFIVGTHSPDIYESVMSHERHFLIPSEDPRASAWVASTQGEVSG